MSSKFFAQSDSDSYSDDARSESNSNFGEDLNPSDHKKARQGFFALNSESSDECLSESSSESIESKPIPSQPVSKKPGFFDITSSEESEDESQKKTVKSQFQKLKDEVMILFEKIETSSFERKWIETHDLFEEILKKKTKLNDSEVEERFTALLTDIEDDIGSIEDGKALSKLEAKAIFALKQKLRKIKQSREELLKQSLNIPEIKLNANKKEDDTSVQKKVVKRDLSQIELTSVSVFEVIGILKASHSKKSLLRTEGLSLLRKGLDLCLSEGKSLNALYVMYSIIGFELEFPMSHQFASEICKDFKNFSELYNQDFFVKNYEDDGFSEVKEAPEQLNKFPMLAFRLRDEINKLVNSTDHHSSDFGELLVLIDSLACSIDRILGKTDNHNDAKIPLAILLIELVHCHPFVNRFDHISEHIRMIYKYGHPSQKIECALMHISMLAKSDRYVLAKNLWLQMRIGDFIADNNVRLGIVYNRTLAHLGLSAFRSGFLKDSYFLLQEICSSGKPKELLGQQIINPSHISYQVPYYMHINIEALDAVFSISSFILECPQLSLNDLVNQLNTSNDLRKSFNYQCRHLKRLLDFHDRSIYYGPPENTRECIILAAKSLLRGDYTTSYDMLSSLRVWKVIGHSGRILEMLGKKIDQAKEIICEIDKLWSLPEFNSTFIGEISSFDTRSFSNRQPDFIRKLFMKINDSSSYFGEEDFREISSLKPVAVAEL